MTTMINNFTLHDRLCRHHGEYCTHVAIEPGASNLRMACHACLSSNLGDGAKMLSIDKFRDYLGAVVRREDEMLHRQGEGLDVRRIIGQRRQEYEQKQFRALELVMKRLGDEKQAFFAELDAIERYYLQK